MKLPIRAITGVALLSSGLLGGVGSAASGATTNGSVKVFVTPNDTTTPKHPGKILLTGAIGDYGTVTSTNAAGKPTKNGDFRLLKLKKGTIVVNITSFQQQLGNAFSSPAALDGTTCSMAVSASGPITIVSGSKSYAGITGSFTMTGVFGGLAARTKHGGCTTKTTAPPVATFLMLTGSGTVTVP